MTDKAIIEAVLSYSPQSIIDIGCGEGWLIREFAQHVSRTFGVDAIPELIEHAKTAGGGDFFVLDYDAIASGTIEEKFDVAVCNFSLLGKTSVESLFKAMPTLLKPYGRLIVQTLHPVTACGDLPYADGWREGSWQGFNADFVDPPPWYFRTIESWQSLFSSNGLRLVDMQEPIYPQTDKPESILFIGESCTIE